MVINATGKFQKRRTTKSSNIIIKTFGHVMNWNDSGFLLSKNKYNENSIIAEIFTEHHGKCFRDYCLAQPLKKLKIIYK